jgi:hypothetical protein
MAALTDLSDLINRLTGGNSGTPETQFWHKMPRVAGAAATAPIAGRAASMWTYDGYPAGGAVPGAVAIPDRTTQGALTFTPPGGGREKFMISIGAVPSVAGVYLLYDRLMHIGGLSGTSVSAQIVQNTPASPAITRNTGGVGNIAWYEIYTTIGTTGRTLTVNYVDQDGNAASSTVNIGATNFREVTRVQRVPLASGDTGIRSITSVQLDASTGTAGSFGMTLAQPLAWIPVGVAGAGGWRDYTTGLPGIPVINSDACLGLIYIPVSAAAPELWTAATFVEK